MLTVKAEDCWGILTQDVKALHDSYIEINANTDLASAAKAATGEIEVGVHDTAGSASKKKRPSPFAALLPLAHGRTSERCCLNLILLAPSKLGSQ